MEINEQPLSPKIRARLLLLVITSSITLVLAVTLVIILTLESFTGITSTPPLVLNACDKDYFKAKYSTPSNGIAIVYITAFFSIVFQIAICVLVFPPLIMRVQPNGRRLYGAYILVALHTMSVILVFGRYLDFHVDLHAMDSSTCSASYSEVLIKVVLAFATADFSLSLLQCIFMLMTIRSYFREQERALKYQQITNPTHQTVQNAMDEHVRKMNNFHQRMPIEISMGTRPFETASTPRRQDIGARQIIQDQKIERKQTLLAETNKEASRPKPKPQERFERKDTDLSSNVAMEMKAKPTNKPDRRGKYEITSSINEVFIPRTSSRKKSRSEVSIFSQNYPFLAQRNLQRVNTNFEEESQQSMAQERKQNLNLQANLPGPIAAVKTSEPRGQQVNQSTRGYLNFVRRMHIHNGEETEGELIASIRGKYGK